MEAAVNERGGAGDDDDFDAALLPVKHASCSTHCPVADDDCVTSWTSCQRGESWQAQYRSHHRCDVPLLRDCLSSLPAFKLPAAASNDNGARAWVVASALRKQQLSSMPAPLSRRLLLCSNGPAGVTSNSSNSACAQGVTHATTCCGVVQPGTPNTQDTAAGFSDSAHQQQQLQQWLQKREEEAALRGQRYNRSPSWGSCAACSPAVEVIDGLPPPAFCIMGLLS